MSTERGEDPSKTNVEVDVTKEDNANKNEKSVEGSDEYADAEKNYQPRSLKFWLIIVGVFLSIFLVALVSLFNQT